MAGIDDVCKRKRTEYFTILVNLATRKVVDLIEGRTIEIVAEWLKKFPNIKIASRDGSTTYRSAIEKANPNIIQVSDRFHEKKALSEALEKCIRRLYSKNILVVQGEDCTNIIETNFNEEYNQLSKKEKENYDRKNAEFKQIKEYYNKCNNYSKTAKKFNIDWRTVKEYSHMDRLPIAKRKGTSKLDKYKTIIIDNIDKKASEIYKILKKKGYNGTYINLRSYIYNHNLRVSTVDKNKYVNRSYIIDILHHKSISDLKLNDDDEKLLKLLFKQDKKLSKIIEISDNFSIALFSEKVEKIEQWIEEANTLNISELNTFIGTIENDIIATKNSVTYLDVSNGLTEGKNCKMKFIKRMMYGRCTPKLLRAKLLQVG